MIKFVFKLLKLAGLVIVILSILFLARCMYFEVSQRDNLLSLCNEISTESMLQDILSKAKKEKFEIRSESLRSSKDRDWFNREYDRMLDALRKNDKAEKSLTIIFAKPGIGYYACTIEHEDSLVKGAKFLDRSS